MKRRETGVYWALMAQAQAELGAESWKLEPQDVRAVVESSTFQVGG